MREPTQTIPEVDGIVPGEVDAQFLAQHLSAYAFVRPFMQGKSVLEIGFGEGYGSDYLGEEAAHVTGIDMAPGNAERAHKNYPRKNLTFLHMEGTELDFPDNHFDAACSFQVIEHIPEPYLAKHVQEVHRVVKPGGFYFVSTLNVAHAMKPGKPYEKLFCHEKEFTGPELSALLGQTFSRVEMNGLYLGTALNAAVRLKKWGFNRWGGSANPLANFLNHKVGTKHFSVKPSVSLKATDLFAIAYK